MNRLIVFLCLWAGLFLEPSLARSEIQVGAAVRIITPDPLLPVSGGLGKPQPTKEKRGDLTARALVFRKGEGSGGIRLGGSGPRQGAAHPGAEHPYRLDAHS